MTSPTPSPSDQAAGKPAASDVIDGLFLQQATWTAELGYAINSNDFHHLLGKMREAAAPTTGSAPVAWMNPSENDVHAAFVWQRQDWHHDYTVAVYRAAPASPDASVLTAWRSPLEKPESISPAHPVQVLAVIDDPSYRINGDDPFVDIAAYWPALDKWTITSQCRADEDVADTLVNVAFWMPLPAAPIKREMFLLAASMGGAKHD